MLADIVGHIQKNFSFDHIGIGILDYVTKDIEIKAEAGITAQALGKRIPLGAGILGRVARTGEAALVQTTGDAQLQGVMPGARSVLCIPISYGESMLGVLNMESQKEDAFLPQDRLIMNTLADLLATALHNAFVFQKLQQQSITDGLTGIKTRRFFFETLSSELKRASRSGRPISVVLMDLDKFKGVNDTKGHLEGDLVLARVGRLLEQKCRQSNVVARYGGDEFIILMPETGVEQALILAERLRLWIAQDPALSEHHITGSFGVGSFPVHGFSMEDIIRVADAGMYVSKHAGGDRVSTAEEIAEGETAAVRRRMISGYIEGFLQREHTGPEHLEELIATLKKMVGEGERNAMVLREAIETLTSAAESRELNSSGHGEMVARYSEIIARALGLPPEEIGDLAFAARVHDVGKIFVPERILNKPGPLTEEEYYLLKWHAEVGGEIVATLPEGKKLQEAVHHHHESFDGGGYPDGLRGEKIPLVGAHHGHHRRLREHDQRALLRRRQNQRTGAGGTRKDERHPLRRDAGAHPASRTQVGAGVEAGASEFSIVSLCRLGSTWPDGVKLQSLAAAVPVLYRTSRHLPIPGLNLKLSLHVYPSFSLWQGCSHYRRFARHWCGDGPHVCGCGSTGAVQLRKVQGSGRTTGQRTRTGKLRGRGLQSLRHRDGARTGCGRGKAFGRLDILVANHGVWPPQDAPIEKMSDAQWRSTMAINLDSVFALIKHSVAQMKKQGKSGAPRDTSCWSVPPPHNAEKHFTATTPRPREPSSAWLRGFPRNWRGKRFTSTRWRRAGWIRTCRLPR